jgi:hypothetical protein
MPSASPFYEVQDILSAPDASCIRFLETRHDWITPGLPAGAEQRCHAGHHPPSNAFLTGNSRGAGTRPSGPWMKKLVLTINVAARR